ncbi:MCE family protein [Marmoricola sp. URHB0036]|uniref:MCE family protein n=1 Tax=Marmoricola sp. URHB0036 TaxID=1298863 RepID=UPI00055D1452|nr:MlaD family protein [Marmoricola sp. URHB0036]
MSHGVRVRLIAFLVLSAVGIVYVASSFLGLTDRLLGRGLHIKATLPDSGGLYTGSEVTYRGVKVGKVSGMHVTRKGLLLTLNLEDGTKIPLDTKMHVHNLSAVGEQYLDFEPPDDKPPYAKAGDTIAGDKSSLPMSEETLLTQMNSLVSSVDSNDLSTVIGEAGTMFRGTANPLQRMVDSGSHFVDEAAANQDATIALLNTGQTVLKTQARHEQDIQAFARDLADLTGTLRTSDKDIRTVLQGGPPAVREVNSLLKGLEPTLPVFLSNLVTTNQVLTANLPALEQMLVVFPHVIAAGFTGTPGDGYGHINLQFNNSVGPCTKGYKPPSQWRPATDTTDAPIYPAQCQSGDPKEMRGFRNAPQSGTSGATGRSYRVAPYDARTGVVDTGSGQPLVVENGGGLQSVFGADGWKWMLMGPEAAGD